MKEDEMSEDQRGNFNRHHRGQPFKERRRFARL